MYHIITEYDLEPRDTIHKVSCSVNLYIYCLLSNYDPHASKLLFYMPKYFTYILFPLSQICIKWNLHLQLCPNQSHQERVPLLRSKTISLNEIKLTVLLGHKCTNPIRQNVGVSLADSLCCECDLESHGASHKTIMFLLIIDEEAIYDNVTCKWLHCIPTRHLIHLSLGKIGGNITDGDVKCNLFRGKLLFAILCRQVRCFSMSLISSHQMFE